MVSSGGMRPHPEALYYHIAGDAIISAKSEADEFRRKQLVATAIVFSAMCLEAFVNQEYGRLNYLEEDVDRVPLHLKWHMLPLLIGSRDTFDKGREPYQTFRSLVAMRNWLVHFKPAGQDRVLGREHSRQYFGEAVDDVATAERQFRNVAEMIRELNRLTRGATDVPKFLEGERYLSEVWATITVPWESTGPETLKE